ncbi:MAG: hypothetical protein NWE93_09925 [Candidatus Bathyarchaeota archaeon]|nr:hypothetical protein [Candidatus Bathyarchaeota archaeon]
MLLSSILLTFLAASTFSMLPAEATVTPSVPAFTLKLVNHTYDTAATTSTDPYTGQPVTNPGSHIEWVTADFTIINQHYDVQQEGGYNLVSGLQYALRYRGHFSDQNWIPLNYAGSYRFPSQDEAQTVISVGINMDSRADFLLPYDQKPNYQIEVTAGGTVDFQVQALIGTASHNPLIPFSGWVFNGTESGWSSPQTVALGETINYPLPNVLADFADPSTSMAPHFQTNGLEGTDLWMVCTVVSVAAVAVLVAVVFILLQSKKANSRGGSG